MAYYDAYRSAPGWGTSNYQFHTPMQPAYQPQPNWRGVDYYRAHGGLGDPDIYDYAWNRARSHSGVGISKEEARSWHRRAYGGLGDILRMLPRDVGAAAAYEAWRNWKYHYGIYAGPLAGDRERQLEALTGLAVSEATRLWQHTGRPTDAYGRLEASEAAAGTAALILEQAWLQENGGGYDAYPGRGRLSRRSSAASLHSYSRSRSRTRPVSPFLSESYGVPGYAGSVGSYSPNAYSSSVYDASVPHVRHRSYSNAAAYPVNYSTMQGQSPYLQPTYSQGYPYAQPAYTSTPAVTVIQPSSSHHRSHSRHGHRSGSRRHSSSRHRHSGSYGNGGAYYVASSVPYAGY